MLHHVLSTYQRFARWARQSRWHRPVVTLEVVALEERATPATTANVTLVAPPQAVLVGPIVAGSLAVPMAGQSMVRLDLIGPGEAVHVDDVWSEPDGEFAQVHVPEPTAPPKADDAALSDEELAEFLAARPDSA